MSISAATGFLSINDGFAERRAEDFHAARARLTRLFGRYTNLPTRFSANLAVLATPWARVVEF